MQIAINEYDKLPDMINAFAERIKEIGPNPFKSM
jgi:quinone-modifying oxidoreductase subunit QmoB